ncbi:MAG: bifunctional 23S rRNA (guanine(2069)-N(7))-methyltransferase RlmK/23S rRNA (guanine(2445)-N(2))-methyltransferase RlmL [Desulfofustis sp.]|nr:bifunctional 23S rRNA (guanine(2069)-N(7))-methyltransferase RlmK/23S rRNA (guanine(2445)-N(2))-methyltransferase RlmL [Desulfofustis sp.]
MNFVSTCAAGLEVLVVEELKSYGAEISSSRKGEIRWSATLEAGYRACLWSRFSSRLVLVLSEFAIDTTDDLYEAAKTTTWEDHLSVDDSFAVDCVLAARGPVTNSMYGALRIKDGIVDRFRECHGTRPGVETQRPDVRVYLQVLGNRVLLGLDLSGEGLHRRGYRVDSGPAPLKENLAAAIVALSSWDGSTPLIDPMCGSATLLIEAALMKADSAPGLSRTYYGLTGWRGHQQRLWDMLVAEALDREARAQEQKWPSLIGYDGDRSAVRAARKNIVKAGIENRVQIEQRELHQLKNDFGQPGFLVCNPPYGERLSDSQSVKHLYRHMGDRFQDQFSGWKITLFTAAPDYADCFKLRLDKSVKIFNGPLACRLFSGSPQAAAAPGAVKDWQIGKEIEQDTATELANRLKKNYRKFNPWACGQNLDWYRLYDRDLPQFNVTIDVTNTHLYIREFPPPPGKDPRIAEERFREVTRTVRALFAVSRDQVMVHRGLAAQKGSKKGGVRSKQIEIREGNAVFLVGGEADPEWSFFPDQRFVRRFLGQNSGRGKFLSIFDTSGGATISVALGGAIKTVTIGGGARNLETVVNNFSRNGLHPDNHRVYSDSVMSWLKKNRQPFDLIHICFRKKQYRQTNSSIFKVGSGHRLLIDRTIANLTEGGRLVVSSLLPNFELDPTLKDTYSCRDVSQKLLSPDVTRGAQNFKCWEISR